MLVYDDKYFPLGVYYMDSSTPESFYDELNAELKLDFIMMKESFESSVDSYVEDRFSRIDIRNNYTHRKVTKEDVKRILHDYLNGIHLTKSGPDCITVEAKRRYMKAFFYNRFYYYSKKALLHYGGSDEVRTILHKLK